MGPKTFEAELKKLAPDLRLMKSAVDGLWWVVQQRVSYSGIVLADGMLASDFYKLFPLKDVDGKFRMPEPRDVEQAKRMVHWGHKLWEKGGDWYADQLEKQETDQEIATALKRRQTAEAATIDSRSFRRGGRTIHFGKS